MSKLTKLLEYGFAGQNEQHRLREKESFKKTLGEEAYKTLLQSENYAITNSTLVQEEVYKTVIEGMEPFRVIRDVIPIIKTESYSIRFVKGETGTYADKVAEGGVINIDTQTYTKQDITIDKYGTRPIITNELIEDSLFGIVELELKKAGARMENKLNRVMLYQMLVGSNKISTNTVSPAGPHIDVKDISLAISKIKKQNYMPDTMVTHPTAEGYLLQDSNLVYASYAGTAATLRTGVNPKILGLTPVTCTATDAASPVWDDTTAGSDVTAMIFSKSDLAALCMRRDLTIERYDDPIHDLIGMSLTMRYGGDVLRENSGCIIYHK